MTEPSCPGCRESAAVIATLLQRVEQLEAKVKELEARLGQNSSNSSLPPSQNPLGAPKPAAKAPSGRRPGGQPGHQGHHKTRLPPQRVRHAIALVPSRCEACSAPLPARPQPHDPEPTWHQVAELPAFSAVVTEFQGHARTCPRCRHVTREAIPEEITQEAYGPRFQAALSFLAGCQHVSKRGLGEVVESLLGVPVSLGTIATLERRTSAALAGPHREILRAVQEAAVKNVDETSWKQAGQKRWLWVAVTSVAVFFAVKLRRSAEALRSFLGESPKGVVGSDRFSAYGFLAEGQRQLCWAHLKRDFQAMAERAGKAKEVGEGLLGVVKEVFRCWRLVRAGKRSRDWLAKQVEKRWHGEAEGLLLRGLECGCVKSAETCRNILEVEEALWTFAHVEGAEPTNNAAERALRTAVIWRKKSFGSRSEAGCELVGRLLSVAQTVRLRGGKVLDYLTEAIRAHRHGLSTPSVLAPL
jgi:transposase